MSKKWEAVHPLGGVVSIMSAYVQIDAYPSNGWLRFDTSPACRNKPKLHDAPPRNGSAIASISKNFVKVAAKFRDVSASSISVAG